MDCTVCGAYMPTGETVCVACGGSMRLPVLRRRETVPAIWRQAAPVVARGAALVALGVLSEWLLRSAAKRALSLPFNRRRRKRPALSRPHQQQPRGIIAVSETVIARRVIYRS